MSILREGSLAASRQNRKRAVNLFHALEMVRASIDEVSCLMELDKRIRRDLQQISRFIDLTLKKEKP